MFNHLDSNTDGFVYLLHFNRPISPDSTCQHYLGWTHDLSIRLQQHETGNGARLCEVAKERGIRFKLVRVWRGGRQLERLIKKHKNHPRYCPLCQEEPRSLPFMELTREAIKQAVIPW